MSARAVEVDGAGQGGGGARSGSSLRRLYGASPWHLAALLACFAASAYAVSRLTGDPALLRIAVWFVGAAVVWDLVVGPLIALADRALLPLRRRPRRVALLNHVRVPALTSALLLVVWAPVILQRSSDVFRAKAGLGLDLYLGRWLAVTALLFALSAAVYAVRAARAAGVPRPGARSGGGRPAPPSPAS